MITSRSNTAVRLMRELARESRARRGSGLFFADGEKLLAEAVSAGIEIVSVLRAGIDAPREIIEYVSPLKTPQDTVFTGRIPAPSREVTARTVILDGMRDPGNVGSIIRTARAFGFGVIFDGACADPWSPKAIRAGMGAVFSVKTPPAPDGEIFSADLTGESVYGKAFPERFSVVIGGEGGGISERWSGFPKITIPMKNGCESLGAAVAAGIIMGVSR